MYTDPNPHRETSWIRIQEVENKTEVKPGENGAERAKVRSFLCKQFIKICRNICERCIGNLFECPDPNGALLEPGSSDPKGKKLNQRNVQKAFGITVF